MKLLDRIKRTWRSLRFKESDIIDGILLVGSYSDNIGSDMIIDSKWWKNSMGSYQIKVDSVIGNKVSYYHWYVYQNGERLILTNHKLIIDKKTLCKRINRLHLINYGKI